MDGVSTMEGSRKVPLGCDVWSGSDVGKLGGSNPDVSVEDSSGQELLRVGSRSSPNEAVNR